jgi:hypothetical protein
MAVIVPFRWLSSEVGVRKLQLSSSLGLEAPGCGTCALVPEALITSYLDDFTVPLMPPLRTALYSDELEGTARLPLYLMRGV